MKRASLGMTGAVVAATALALSLGPTGASAVTAAVDINPNTDGPVAAGVDADAALVVLSGDPLSTAPGTRNAKGRVDMAKQETKSAHAKLAAQRNALKKWLKTNAPKVVVTGEHDLAMNAVTVKLNGTALSTVQAAPGVVGAQYELMYHPLADANVVPVQGSFDGTHPDLSLIHAIEAWGMTATDHAPAPAKAGQGVKVAIVDTGIDITNPCFSDAGYDSQTKLGDQTYTNNKVIVAKVFSNKTPSRHYTPEPIQDHGTHVAGTVACDYGVHATVDGVDIPYPLSGVAPHALLGNYNIFPGDITNARSEDILNALEAAYADGMDVANMSLGGDSHGIQDLLTKGVDNLTAAGMVIAVAAGNSGSGVFTTESPGSAQGALTAGASTVPHFISTPVTFGGHTYNAASGDFSTVDNPLTASLAVVTGDTNGLSTACQPLSNIELSGSIAVISRGTCSFSTKIRNAEDAGAAAVLVVNNVAGSPIAMASDGTPDQPTVPAYMLPLAAAADVTGSGGEAATIGTLSYVQQPGDRNIMAGFSSVGPVDVSYRIKPDAVAPGVNVLSSIPHQFCDNTVDTNGCFAFFQGTSMATPHLAGSAAVLLSQHSTWTPAQIQSAIANTAERAVLRTSDAQDYVVNQPNSVQIQGGGLENLEAATDARVFLSPVSVSFGAVPHGSGKGYSQTVTVTNATGTPQTLTASIADAVTTDVTFSVSSRPINVPANGSATVTVSVSNAKQATFGENSAYLVLRDGQDHEVAHAALFEAIK